MLSLYPPITPYSTGFLQVDDVHQLYWEQVGNPDGVPVVFLHGGPGGGASHIHRQYFDPNFYRIIIFDQRGAGRSHPIGSLENNTPWTLVDDMEKLRTHLRIERWHLFGGSWGSTLALLYALRYTSHCLGLVLNGISLLTRDEINWFQNGLPHIFPEAHRAWLAPLTDAERANPLAAYEHHLNAGTLAEQVEYARAWYGYEAAACLPATAVRPADPVDAKAVWALARIECHYFRHHTIEGDTAILPRVGAIAHLPLIIVQGRYDMICPIRSADALHRAWPNSELIVVEGAGHSINDRGMSKQLIEATNRMCYLRNS